MAEKQESDSPPPEPIEDTGEEITPGYQAPAKKDLKTIQNLDQDDESLVKYKQQLLGATSDVLDEGGSNVIMKKLIFAPEGRDPVELDLTGDLSTLKSKPITIKEGCMYRMKVVFRVQREIVSGLYYYQDAYRKGIKVDKSHFMVGSYGPKTEEYTYQTPSEEAPSGLLKRGTYNVKSKFTDDDKFVYAEWEWAFQIKKEWD